MYLSDEQWELVHNNKRLVYFSLKKQGIFKDSPIWEDMESIGTYGLIIAAATYDPTKKSTFANYAITCINNEIRMYFRKEKKHMNDVSLDEPTNYSKENEEEVTIGDTIVHPQSFFDREIFNKAKCAKVLSIILNVLSTREKLAILWKASGMSQKDIAERLHISPSLVSRIINRIICNIKRMEDGSTLREGLYSVSLPSQTDKIVISIPNNACFEGHFLEIFNDALDELEAIIPEFTLECKKEKITIYLPLDTDSFIFIASIVKGVDEYNVLP